MKHGRYIRSGVLLGWLLWLGTFSAWAQRTLVVQNGKIWLDGRPIALERSDRPLEVDPALSLRLQFAGDESPIFSLNGQFFQVKGDRIVSVAPAQLFDRGPFIASVPAADTANQIEAVLADLVEQARALQEEAERVAQHLERQQQIHAHELERQLQAIRQQAMMLSERARLLPRMEWEAYLMRMRRHDAELARQLVEEWAQEQMLRQQALQIRQMPEGSAREQAIAELRQQLEEAFARKQQNRRQEIAQLERQLRLLRQRLDERERQRQQLIEQRLRELIGKN